MYSNFNQVIGYNSNSIIKTSESESNGQNTEKKLLNSKIYNLNNSLSKFVCVGMSVLDFAPRILIGGQNGFNIILTDEQWKDLQKNQGLVLNYFYSSEAETYPLKIGDIMVYFENINQFPIIRIQKGGSYVRLGKESVDKLFELEEIVEYRIQIIKKQEFQKYFNLFYHYHQQSGDLSTFVYDVINPSQNPNSENVSTMLEMLVLHSKELEKKLKKGNPIKRKYYEEISDY